MKSTVAELTEEDLLDLGSLKSSGESKYKDRWKRYQEKVNSKSYLCLTTVSL